MKRDANDILRQEGAVELRNTFDRSLTESPKRAFRPTNGGRRGNENREVKPRKFIVQKANTMTFVADHEWLIKGVLPLQGVALVFGEPQSFKSFSILDVLDRVSRGENWGARKTVKVPVLYIAAEAPASFIKRKTGIETANKEPLSDDFHVITVAPNLGTERNDLEELVATIEESGVKPGVICIDTVSASLGGGEENGTGSQIFLANARVLSNHFKACVIPVHHPGLSADKRPRGHSSLTGNIDVQIFAEREGDGLATTLTVQKLKDGPAKFNLTVHLSPIVIGQDGDGDDVSTLVVTRVEEGGAPKVGKPSGRVTRSRRALMDAVVLAIDEASETIQPFPNGPTVRAVKDESVRRRYNASLAEKAEPDENPKKFADRMRNAFKRAVLAAIQSKELMAKEINGERFLWLP